MINLLVKSDGIYLIPEMPEKPKRVDFEYELPYCKALKKHERTIQSAKDSAIWVLDQTLSEKLIYGQHGMIDSLPLNYYQWKDEYFKKDVIYPITGWRFEIRETCASDCCAQDGGCEHCREPKKVAILIERNQPGKPDSSEKKPEKIIFGIRTTGMTDIDPLWKGYHTYKESSPTDDEYKERFMAFLEEKRKETVEPEKPDFNSAGELYANVQYGDMSKITFPEAISVWEEGKEDYIAGANHGYSVAQSELTRLREENEELKSENLKLLQAVNFYKP